MIKCGVLGSPITHSLSPIIHQCAYEIVGWSWRYERHEVRSGGLEQFLGDYQGEFRGLSLTMPLKEEAVALLTDASELAKRISAVNTIVFDELGAHGFNTDVQGFVDALSHHGIVIPEIVSILGGGATARAAIAAVDGKASRIEVYSRSEHRARALVNAASKSIVKVKPWSVVGEAFSAPLTIGTTPQGATDDLHAVDSSNTYFESLYSPWPTPLLARWRASGGKGIDGLDLLVWQAIGQLEVMAFDSREVSSRRGELHDQMRAAALKKLQA